MDGNWWIEALGLAAGLQTTLAFVPQVLKVWRSRQARDISLATFLLLGSGVGCWLVYGLLRGSPSIVLANGATLLLVCLVIALKRRYDRQ